MKNSTFILKLAACCAITYFAGPSFGHAFMATAAGILSIAAAGA